MTASPDFFVSPVSSCRFFLLVFLLVTPMLGPELLLTSLLQVLALLFILQVFPALRCNDVGHPFSLPLAFSLRTVKPLQNVLELWMSWRWRAGPRLSSRTIYFVVWEGFLADDVEVHIRAHPSCTTWTYHFFSSQWTHHQRRTDGAVPTPLDTHSQRLDLEGPSLQHRLLSEFFLVDDFL